MKKQYLILMIVLCLVLGGAFLGVRISMDREAPQIRFPKETVTYRPGEEEALLQGVQAIDETDGDVSGSLRIEDIFTNAEDETAVVVYVAKDSHHNVRKERRQVSYQEAAQEQQEAEEAAENEDDTEETGAVSEIPVLKLKESSVEIPVDSIFNALSYVEDITDDKDTSSDLWRKIDVSGVVDSTKEGTYELQYTVLDSDGNRSEPVGLTVVIKENAQDNE